MKKLNFIFSLTLSTMLFNILSTRVVPKFIYPSDHIIESSARTRREIIELASAVLCLGTPTYDVHKNLDFFFLPVCTTVGARIWDISYFLTPLLPSVGTSNMEAPLVQPPPPARDRPIAAQAAAAQIHLHIRLCFSRLVI